MELTQSIKNKLASDRWFHATRRSHFLNILNKGVIVDYNRYEERDFGYGFYLTVNEKMAENFAKRILAYELDESDDPLVIMEFAFCPLDYFANNDCNCAVFSAYDDTFAEFVLDNRIHGLEGIQRHDYHIIYGVMSDSNPAHLIPRYRAGVISKDETLLGLKKGISTKQLSLHTQSLCDKLVLKRVYEYNPETETRKELDWNE